MKATDLRQALNVLDPEQPLLTDEHLDEWYVARPESPIGELRILLQDSDKPQKVLFTGHRGSGKTTELAKLRQQLRDRFFIVHYSVKSVLNLFDLTYVDVVLSLGLQLIKAATVERVNVRKDVLAQVLKFGREIAKETETGEAVQAGVRAELNLFVAKLTGKLGKEDVTRLRVRETVSHRLSELLENIDILSREVEKTTGRSVLIIVEDLDKADLEQAKGIFYGHATSLLEPPVSVIYTFPNALRHDNDFMQIESSFPNSLVFPNFKARLPDGKPDRDGLATLRDVVTLRVDESLLAPEALDRMAELSSGIPRELVALARLACLEARKAGRPGIEMEDVERAARRKTGGYQVILTSPQLELLRRVHETKDIENDAEHRTLLHLLSALEYRNTEIWYDVHPLVEPLLKRVRQP